MHDVKAISYIRMLSILSYDVLCLITISLLLAMPMLSFGSTPTSGPPPLLGITKHRRIPPLLWRGSCQLVGTFVPVRGIPEPVISTYPANLVLLPEHTWILTCSATAKPLLYQGPLWPAASAPPLVHYICGRFYLHRCPITSSLYPCCF